jgi:hypothetical protein
MVDVAKIVCLNFPNTSDKLNIFFKLSRIDLRKSKSDINHKGGYVGLDIIGIWLTLYKFTYKFSYLYFINIKIYKI